MLIKKNIIESDYKKYIPVEFQNEFNQDFVVLDIETTGFSRENCSIILIGIIIKTNNNIISQQIFCESLSEEKKLLTHLQNTLLSLDKFFLITYNGHSFDIPFINNKFNKYHINYQINNIKNFDIYRMIRANKKLLNLEKYNLKSIEKFLNINRLDTISGKDSIRLYYEYLRTKNTELLNKILLHNQEDILYLLKLLKILNYFTYNQFIEFFPKKITNNIHLETSKINRNYLIVTLYSKKYIPINYFDEYLSATSKDNNITLKITLSNFLIEYNNYHLVNSNIIYNSNLNDLTNDKKNYLIIAINNEIQYSKLINVIKDIIKKIKS
ncbi:MAG: ribonuclease H-like domain-containing protein [Bacillota bacterium]|nr:ribonuclease H-like domain-containing protein [Bacillota bacterium]